MEYVIKELLHPEEDDEANFIYSELDSQRRETRRVEFYPSGMCFAIYHKEPVASTGSPHA